MKVTSTTLLREGVDDGLNGMITEFSLNERAKTVIGDSLQTVKGPLNGGGTNLMIKANTLVLHK